MVVLMSQVGRQTRYGTFELREPLAEGPRRFLWRGSDEDAHPLGQLRGVIRYDDAVLNYAVDFHGEVVLPAIQTPCGRRAKAVDRVDPGPDPGAV